MSKTVEFTKKEETAAPQPTAAAPQTEAPAQDTFDYASIEQEMYLPNEELTLFGAEMMQIKGALERYLQENTQAVFGPDNQPSGHFLHPHAQPIAELYGMVYRTLHRRFYEDGKTVSFDKYKEKMQTMAMTAEEQES